MKQFFLIILLLMFALVHVCHAQQVSDTQLAQEYYRSGDYEKAAVLYEKLFNANKSDFYYFNLINSLNELKEFDRAEKIIKKQIKQYPGDVSYLVDLGYLLIIQGKTQKGYEQYDEAISLVKPDHNMINKLANGFIMKREYGYAEKTYLAGRKAFQGMYNFSFELANIYFYQRNFQKMIDEYLDILSESSSYIQTVQNRLQGAVYSDVENDLNTMLKASLLARIQRYPEKQIYSELLIWIYQQEKDFASALVQVRALDMRNSENGQRLIALARLAAGNNQKNIAIEAYDLVIAKGSQSDYYLTARAEKLDVLFQHLSEKPVVDNTEIADLERQYENAIAESGFNNETIEMIRSLAHLKAFHLDKTAEAILMLEEALKIRGATPNTIALCKLELADIYLIDNNPWDAIITYAQIEEANKNNPVGYEAKFRRARLAYFQGNFEWAGAQLDVLKASTSKLIANDACRLSLIIFDNEDEDTVSAPLKMYTRADFLTYRKKDTLALQTLDSLITLYSSHPVIDDVFFLKAKILNKLQRYDQAAEVFGTLATEYIWDIYGDDALFALAVLYEEKLGKPDKAMELYEKIIIEMQGSIFVSEARERLRILRDKKPKI